MDFKATPKSFTLGLLQAAAEGSIPIRVLIQAGGLFGFSDNTIRVTVLRLLAGKTIESDGRGRYRISSRSSSINRFVTGWRLGESRNVPWDGGWIGCFLPKNQNRHKSKNQKALHLLGFREGMPKFWVRPNNLSIGFDDLKTILAHFGLDEKAQCFTAHRFSEDLVEQWKRYLWPLKEIQAGQVDLTGKLNFSSRRIETLSPDDALVETFLLGSRAIHMLLSDPLLPQQIMPNASRLELTRAMLEYDVLGKRMWQKRLGDFLINTTPHHMAFPVEGALGELP